MKKIYMVLAAALLAFGASAQHDLAVNLVSHSSGGTDASDPLTFQFEAENVGDSTILTGDTVWFCLLFNGDIVGLDLATGGVNGFILEEDLAPGDVFLVPEIGIDWLDQPEPTTIEVCGVVFGPGVVSFSGEGPGIEEIIVNDDDPSNNYDCISAELPVGVDDSGIEDLELVLSEVYVVGNHLTIVNEGVNAENQANLNIINMNGQTVQTENFVIAQGVNTVEINSLSTGIYFVSIEVEGAIITKKVSIQ